MSGAEMAILTQLMNKSGSAPSSFTFLQWLNDGSEGVFNPASNTTLTSDVYRYSSLNIPTGVTVTPSSSWLILLVNGTCNIDGSLSASGKGAPGGTSTQALNQIINGNPGGNGYGDGGGGGAGGIGGGTNGAGGAILTTSGTTITAGATGAASGSIGANATATSPKPKVRFVDYGILLQLIQNYGAGGGSGSCNSGGTGSPGTGGVGGVGGGGILIMAKSITGAGAIRSDGSNGAAGYASGACTTGGGAGGGGGTLILVSPIITTTTLSVAAGIGGQGAQTSTGSATGGNPAYSGGNGASGTILKFNK